MKTSPSALRALAIHLEEVSANNSRPGGKGWTYEDEIAMLRTAADEIAEAQKDLREAREDKERLDWLSWNPIHDIHFGHHPKSIVFNGECFSDLRTAIDTARKGEKEAKP